MSRPTLEALQEAEWLAAREGPVAPRGKAPLVQASEAARAALGDLLNVPADTICWSFNTSTAMRMVMHGLQPIREDLLITSDLEHVATRSLCLGLRDACKLTVMTLETNGEDGDFLTRLDSALRTASSGRKIVLLSHVSCIDGRRLPVEAAVALARRYGGISVIDGAQAVGQFPVDQSRIDSDFYMASGHKWLLGPCGIGYVHVRADRLKDFNPNWLPDAARCEATAAVLGEVGSVNWAQRVALRAAIEQILAIGLDTIKAHVADLSRRLRSGLRQLPGITVLGPDEHDKTTGLICFKHRDWRPQDCQALVEHLYVDHRIVIKYQPEQTALRVSLAGFNTIEEVDSLLYATGVACTSLPVHGTESLR